MLLAGLITVIVFVMIFVVLRRFKPSLLILSSIAFSIVITFNLIYAFKISLNMLTLGALALGFGMFVDNSIVVFENILRLRESGLSPREAALQGPKEVFVAVLASTLTIMAVFFSFPFFQGKLKIYYLPLAIVIASAMAASLLVSFTLVPSLSPRLLEKTERSGRPAEKRSPRFEKALGVLIRHPVEVLLVVAALLFGSYKWFRAEVTMGRWYSWYSKEYLYVRVGMPPGTDIARTDETIRAFEEKVMAQDYEKEMNVRIVPENAQAIIGFPPAIEKSYRPYALKEELIQLATQFAGIDISVSGFDPQYYASSMGAGTYYSSRIKFYGYNLRKLKEITGRPREDPAPQPAHQGGPDGLQPLRLVAGRHGRGRPQDRQVRAQGLRRRPRLPLLQPPDDDPGDLRPAGPDPDGRQGHHGLGQIPRRRDARHARPRRIAHPDAGRGIPPARRDRRLRRNAHPRLDRPREPAVPADDHVGVPRPVQGRGALPQGGLRIAAPARRASRRRSTRRGT